MSIRKYIIIAVAVLGCTGCTDILDTTPYNSIASGNMWKTENLTDQGVNGVYANLRNWGIYGSGLNAGVTVNSNSNGMGQWSYEILGPLGQSHNVADFLSGSINPGSGNVNNLWRKLYEGVHRANDAIANIPSSPCSEAKKARLIAECKFLRAFHYFRLNELWRGVPYYDVPVAVEECIKGQETEAFIWEKVLEDLTACINEPEFLNSDFKDGRVSKGAAYALRGKVYMHLKQWDNAIADFDKVDDCGFGLFTGDYKALFTEANERSREMIFSVQNIELANYGSCTQFYLGTRSAQGSCWGDHKLTPYAVELYENADGTPFNWDDYIPGFSSLALAEREVYFLRDTLDSSGKRIHPRITAGVKTRLDALDKIKAGLSANYLPQGNEARIRAAYANRDPRLEKNVITPYSNFFGLGPNNTEYNYTCRWPYVANAIAIANPSMTVGDFQPDYTGSIVYFQRKFVTEGYNPSPTFSRDRIAIDDPIIRYADVLLMWAEALVEQNDLSGAMAKVQEVRNRVNMTTNASDFADRTTARNYVRDERRREMLGEGGAYFDELRWETLKASKYTFAANKTQAGNETMWGTPERGAAFRWPDVYTAENFVWPVPRAEIEKNPNLKPTPNWTY